MKPIVKAPLADSEALLLVLITEPPAQLTTSILNPLPVLSRTCNVCVPAKPEPTVTRSGRPSPFISCKDRLVALSLRERLKPTEILFCAQLKPSPPPPLNELLPACWI